MAGRWTLFIGISIALLWLCACGRPARAAAPPASAGIVAYEVALPDPASQYVHVRMHVSAPSGQRSNIAMPAWTPGSYLVRDFARHVYDFAATDDAGRALAVTRVDKQTWRVAHGGKPFAVTYRVFAADKSVRTSHVDDTHASLVGTSIFAYVAGELRRPARVDVALPKGWSAHTALDPVHGSATPGHAVFAAPDYDRLVDAPIELGTPIAKSFAVDGARFELVVTGADAAVVDVDRIAADARRIVAAQGRMMGGFPFQRYVFLLELVEEGGGGLEHATSTSMMLRRSAFDEGDGYARARRLVAHEFFHLWNVKRIHDAALGPFDYARENHSELLWLHEGVTETMEAMSLVHAGLVPPDDFVRELGREWTSYVAKPGRNHDPIAQISFEAWIKAYQPAKNHDNVAISYYEKGKLIGIALDLELRLRAAEHGREGSLAGMFRRLMRSHAERGKGITKQDVALAASKEAGEEMAWFFDRYVDGTEEIPLPALVQKIGVVATDHAPWTNADGSPKPDAAAERTWSGLQLTRDGRVDNVLPSSPAAKAGMMLDDEIVAVDGKRAQTRTRIEALLAARGPGQQVELALFRDGRLVQRTLALTENPNRAWRFTLRSPDDLPAKTKTLREAWLGPPA